MINDCLCDAGYYDQAPALSQVSCVKIPLQFSSGADDTAKCQVAKFGAGLKQQIKLDVSPSNMKQLGTMVQFLKGVTTDLLYSVDFNFACGALLRQYHGTGTICGHSFPLFGKTGNSAAHVNFLGKATLQCHGFNDLFVLGKVCLEPCISDESQGCCWIPPVLSHFFSCCGKYHCCPETRAPTPAPAAAALANCTDNFPTCPMLKKKFDQINASCFTSDAGAVLHNSKFNGVHFVDQCCASCRPASTDHCAQCIAHGHSHSMCTKIGVCHCSYSAKCMQCLGVSDSGGQTTVDECQSYGIDCTENCSGSSTPRVQGHRRVQGGAAAAVQVQAGGQSNKQLNAILNCLAKGDSVAKCAGSASAV